MKQVLVIHCRVPLFTGSSSTLKIKFDLQKAFSLPATFQGHMQRF